MATNQRDENIRLVFEATGDDQLAQVAGRLTDITNTGGAAGEAAQALLDKLLSLGNTNALIQTLITQKGLLQDNGDALALAKIKLADLQTQMDATTTPSAALERSFAKTQATVASLDAQYNQHKATITATSNALIVAGVDTNNLDSEQRRISQSLAETNEAAEKLGGGMSTVAAQTESAGQKAANAGGLFSTLRDHLAAIVSIAAAVELALKGIEFGKESVEGAEEVEASLSRVKALAQGTQEQFADLDSAIEDAAESVNSTTQNAAAGLAALVAQGLPAKTAIDALIPTLQLAKIANVDVGTAAGVVAKALDAFQLPASAASDVVDRLTSASHGAAGGLSAIGNTVTTLAPDAKALGISFDTLVSIVGLLSTRGIDSEKSLRGLRTVFQDLQNPASTLRVNLLALGDGSNDFGRAVTALSAGTPRAQAALLSLDGPARSLVLTLGQAGPDALAKFQAGLEQTQGAASKTAAAIDDNLRGASTRFENAIDDLGQKLAKPILTPLAAELNKLAGQLNDFSKSPAFQQITADISRIVTDGVQKLDRAIQNFDWKKFEDSAVGALDSVKDTAEEVATAVSAIGTGINKAADVIAGAYHVIGVATDGAVGGTAKLIDTAANLAQKIDTLSEGSTKAAERFDDLHRTLEDVDDIAGGNLKAHVAALGDDVADLAGQSTKAATATHAHADAAAAATPKIQQQGTASKDTAAATEQEAAAHAEATPKVLSASDAHSQLLDNLKKLPPQIQATAVALAQSSDYAHASQTQIESLATAFVGLGIKSQTSLTQASADAKKFFDTVNQNAANTAAGLADKQNAFLAYAKALLAANAQLDAGSQNTADAQLGVQAAILGVSDALSDLEKQSSTSQASLVSDANRGADSLNSEADAARRLAGSLAGGGGGGAPPVDASAKAAQDAVDSMSSEGGSSLAQLDQALADTRSQFLSVSEAAAKAFDSNLVGDFGQTFDATGIGFARVIQSMSEASATVTKTIADQRTQLQAEVSDINNIGVASDTGFGQFGDNADTAIARMKALSQDIQNGTYDAGLLGQQELAPLQAALDAATQRAQALADASKSAAQQLADLNNELADQIDEETGNTTDQENRRHQQQLQQIQDLYKQAGQLGTTAYTQAVQQENQLHDLKMKNIATQQQAQNGGSSPTATSGPGGGSSGSGVGGNGLGGLQQVNIHIAGQQQTGTILGDTAGVQLLTAILQAKANSI